MSTPSYDDYISSISENLKAYVAGDKNDSSYLRTILTETAGIAQNHPIYFKKIATPTDATKMAATETGEPFEFEAVNKKSGTRDVRLRLKNENKTSMFAHINKDNSMDLTIWDAAAPAKAWTLYYKVPAWRM